MGKAFEKEMPYLEKIELQQLWDLTYASPYHESILQVSSNSINYIKVKNNKVNIYDREQTGSLSMTTTKNITSTSTPKENFTVPLEKRKSTLVPDKNLSANLFIHENNGREGLNDTDESGSYPLVAMITDRNKKQKVQQNRIQKKNRKQTIRDNNSVKTPKFKIIPKPNLL